MISDRLKSILSESSRMELIMENLGALRAYPQQMVKQLLTYNKEIGPSSSIVIEKFKNAAAAKRAVQENPRRVFAIVPPSQTAIALLAPNKSYQVEYRIIKNPDFRMLDSSIESNRKLEDILYKGTIKDVYGLFTALTKVYGKNWELHVINIDQTRVEKQKARADAKKGVEAFARKDMHRAPYGSWGRAALMQRLDAYKKTKAPDVKDTAGVMTLITSGDRFPTKFRYNGMTYELGSSRFSIDDRKGGLYSSFGDFNGLEFRANHEEFYNAMRGVPDEEAKKFEASYPRYIKVYFEIKKGSLVPSKVTTEN